MVGTALNRLDFIAEVWFLCRDSSGWLSGLNQFLRLSGREVMILEELEDSYHQVDMDIKAFERETAHDRELGIFYADTPDEKIKILMKHLFEMYKEIDMAMRRDASFF